jgi:hypothetical protein
MSTKKPQPKYDIHNLVHATSCNCSACNERRANKPEPKFKVGQWTRMSGEHSSGKSYAGTVAGAIKSVAWNGREYVYTIQGMGDDEFPEVNIVPAMEPRGKKKGAGAK